MSLDDFERISRCSQHLREERIGIQRDGRYQALQLLGRFRVGDRLPPWLLGL
jgi:hypothetical protein